jgi:hypothetical protein
VAKALRADLTLLAVVKRGPFERGHRDAWPESALSGANEIPAIHRVTVPGPEEEAIPRYANQIAADFLLLGKEHLSRRWFRKESLAASVRAATTSALFVIPDDEVLALDEPRVACVTGGPGHPVYRAATSIICRCGGHSRTWPASFAPYQLVDAAMLENINLVVALDGGDDLLSLARRLPCPLLLLKPTAQHVRAAERAGAPRHCGASAAAGLNTSGRTAKFTASREPAG